MEIISYKVVFLTLLSVYHVVHCETECRSGVRKVNCFISPCSVVKCFGQPKAVCRENYCGACNADFYVNNTKVKCRTDYSTTKLSSLFEKHNWTEVYGVNQTITHLISQFNLTLNEIKANLSSPLIKYLETTRIQDVMWCFSIKSVHEHLKYILSVISLKDSLSEQITLKTRSFRVVKNFKEPNVTTLHQYCQRLLHLLAVPFNAKTYTPNNGISPNQFQVLLLKLGIGKEFVQYKIRGLLSDSYALKHYKMQLRQKGHAFLKTAKLQSDKLDTKPIDILVDASIPRAPTLLFYSLPVFDISPYSFHYFKAPSKSFVTDLGVKKSEINATTLYHMDNIISRKSKSIKELVYKPLIFFAYDAGIRKFENLKKQTVMELSLKGANTTEGFLKVVFNIEDAIINLTKATKIGDLATLLQKKNISNRKMYYLTIFFLLKVQSSSTDNIKDQYQNGVIYVKGRFTLRHIATVLSENITSLTEMTISDLHKKLFDMDNDQLKKSISLKDENVFRKYRDEKYTDVNSVPSALDVSLLAAIKATATPPTTRLTTMKPTTMKPTASPCKMICIAIHAPVCGSDEIAYSNACQLKKATCYEKSVYQSYNGVCIREPPFTKTFYLPLKDVISVKEINKINQMTIFEIAKMYIKINATDILKKFPMMEGLLNYLKSASFLKLSRCYSKVHSSVSINTIFHHIVYLDKNPSQLIAEKLKLFKTYEIDNATKSFPDDYNKTLHDFCPIYEKAIEASYPMLLADQAKKYNSTSKQQNALFKAFGIEQQAKAIVIGSVLKDVYKPLMEKKKIMKIVQTYYNTVNISSIASAINKTKEDVLNMTITEVIVKLKKLPLTSIHFLFNTYIDIPVNYFKIISRMKLKNIFVALNNLSLINSSLGVVLDEIKKRGDSAKMLGNSPMILSAYKAGIIGISEISKHTLMELSLNITRLSEEFMILWFDINQKSQGIMKLFSISKQFSMFSLTRLQHVPIVKLSGSDFSEGKHDEVKKKITSAFLQSAKYLFSNVKLSDLQKMYAMSENDVQIKSVIALLVQHMGFHSNSELKQLINMESFDIFGKNSLNQIKANKMIHDNMTIFAIADSLKFMRIKTKQLNMLTNMQYIALAKHCKIQINLESLSFETILQRCLQVNMPISMMLAQLKDFALMSSRLTDRINETLNHLLKNGISRKQFSYLSIREISALYAVSSYQPNIFFARLQDVIGANVTKGFTMYGNVTISSLLEKHMNLSSEKIKSAVNGWIGDIEKKDFYQVTNVFKIAASLDISLEQFFSLNLKDVISLFMKPEYVRVGLWKYVCKHAQDNVSFADIQSKCNYFSNISVKTEMNSFTIDDLKTVIPSVDVNMISVMTIDVFVTPLITNILQKSKMPLIIAAHEKQISLKKLVETDLVTTSNIIFGLHHDVLKKIFRIGDDILRLAHAFTLGLLHTQEDDIDNVKQIYSVSLQTTFAVITKQMSGADAKRKVLPNVIRFISDMPYSKLAGLYNKNISDFLNYQNLIDMGKDLFGITDEFFKSTFHLSNDDFHLLKSRSMRQINTISMLLGWEFSKQSPFKQGKMIIELKPFKVQNFLFLKYNGTSTIIKEMLPSTISAAQLKTFIETYYNRKDGFKGDIIADTVLNTNLSKIAMKRRIKLSTFVSMEYFELINAVLYDLKVEKYFKYKLSSWIQERRSCFNVNSQCSLHNMFSTVGVKEKDFKNYFLDLGVNEHIAGYIGQMHVNTFSLFLNVSPQEMLNKTIVQIIQETSNEYVRLKTKLKDKQIIKLISKANIKYSNVLHMPMSQLLDILVNTSLSRLQYYEPLKRSLTTAFINAFSNATLNEFKGFKYKNNDMLGLKPSAVVLLTWKQLILYFTQQSTVNITTIKEKSKEKYFQNYNIKSILQMYDIPVASIENKPLIYIASDYLGLSDVEIMKIVGVNAYELGVLKRATPADLTWVNKKLNSSFKNKMIAYLKQLYQKVDAATVTLSDMLKKNGYIKNISVADSLSKYYPASATVIRVFIVKIGTLKWKKFENIFRKREFRLFSKSMVESEEVLQSMKMRNLLTRVNDEIDICNTTSLNCSLQDANSMCSESVYGYQCQCKTGFGMKIHNGTQCFNINECLQNPCRNATCKDTMGDFNCKCNSGYEAKNKTRCIDINECAKNTTCYKGLSCNNTIGSFICGKCPDNLSGTGTTCTDPCKTHKCPGQSTCVNIGSGASCRCISGLLFSSGACKSGTKLIKVENLRLIEMYNSKYADKTSKAFVEKAKKIEDALLPQLLKSNADVIGVQVTKIAKGSLVVDFNVILGSAQNISSNASMIQTSLSNAIKNGDLNILNPNKTALLVSQATDICALGGHGCGAHANCILTDGRKTTFRCDCHSDYEKKNGVCLEEDNNELALKIAVPIVVIVLVAIFVIGVYISRRNNSHLRLGKQSVNFQNEAYVNDDQ